MTERKRSPAVFKPGQSGNPAGKPKGARNHATRALLQLMEGEAEEITRAMVDAAKGGDMAAARFILDKLVPTAKERPVSLELPNIDTASDAAGAQNVILQAVAKGELLPGEANVLSGIVESRRKAMETEDLERRIVALENNK